MRIAPVSADLLIKIGLGVLVLGAGYWVYGRARDGISAPLDWVKASINAIVDAPGQALDAALTYTNPQGAAIQAGNAPQSQELQDLTQYCSLKLNSMPDYRLQSTGAADGKNQEAFEHWS